MNNLHYYVVLKLPCHSRTHKIVDYCHTNLSPSIQSIVTQAGLECVWSNQKQVCTAHHFHSTLWRMYTRSFISFKWMHTKAKEYMYVMFQRKNRMQLFINDKHLVGTRKYSARKFRSLLFEMRDLPSAGVITASWHTVANTAAKPEIRSTKLSCGCSLMN